MTNGDWIRSMDDEQLAKWLACFIRLCALPYMPVVGSIEWVKQEHKEELKQSAE